jgi:hypothetical protein
VTVIDELAALLDTDIDQSRYIWRDGESPVRWQPRAYICHTPREED